MSSFMSQLTTTVSSWSASGGISGILSGIWYSILYGIAAGLCWIIGIVNQFFSVMSGMTKVHYEGKSDRRAALVCRTFLATEARIGPVRASP